MSEMPFIYTGKFVPTQNGGLPALLATSLFESSPSTLESQPNPGRGERQPVHGVLVEPLEVLGKPAPLLFLPPLGVCSLATSLA